MPRPLCDRRLFAILCSIPLAALSACNNGSSGAALANRAVSSPSSVAAGQEFDWSVTLNAGEQGRSTVFDKNNNIVYHHDYASDGQFKWTPFQPGSYLVRVDVKDAAGPIAMGQTAVETLPRGGSIVSSTSHPLVALYTYTIPRGREGDVSYTCTSCPGTIVARTFTTPRLKGEGTEAGVLLPALRPESTYTIQHTIYDGGDVEERGPELDFTSGSIPLTIPTVTVLVPPVNPGLNSLLAVSVFSDISIMVDEAGTPVGYFPNGEGILRPTGDGWTSIYGGSNLRILDHTTQAVRSIDIAAMNAQLATRGVHSALQFHHEVRPLPHGRYAVFGNYERLVTDIQGPGTLDVLGDIVIVVDDQMKVVWTWDAFEHLDLARPAVLNDVLATGTLGIHLQLADHANDWTHMNSIDYDPRDGNLLLSVRNQAWVLKIAYAGGNGDGHIVWRLGEGGDFTLESKDPDPWFGYQHDANVLDDGRLALYDNGNPRVTKSGGNSRGQVYILDEAAKKAVLDVNVDLGVYSFAVGSAALAPDGSYHFNSGMLSIHDTITSSGILHASYHTNTGIAYRSFQMNGPFDTGSN